MWADQGSWWEGPREHSIQSCEFSAVFPVSKGLDVSIPREQPWYIGTEWAGTCTVQLWPKETLHSSLTSAKLPSLFSNLPGFGADISSHVSGSPQPSSPQSHQSLLLQPCWSKCFSLGLCASDFRSCFDRGGEGGLWPACHVEQMSQSLYAGLSVLF